MARRVALIADIHGNLAALEAVLADIKTQQVDAIYCLGDMVGYGPQPVEVVDLVMQVCEAGKVLMGYHDHMLFRDPIGFHRHAQQILRWHTRLLRPSACLPWGRQHQRWEWLKGLPEKMEENNGDVLYVHGSPRSPLGEFLMPDVAMVTGPYGEQEQSSDWKENLAAVQHSSINAHTHRPGVLTHEGWHSPEHLHQRWQITEMKAIINVGSVGQPRDGDPRACYVIFSYAEVVWRRVPYDIEATRAAMHAHVEIDRFQADRLLVGR